MDNVRVVDSGNAVDISGTRKIKKFEKSIYINRRI